jgi:hypothetical protein
VLRKYALQHFKFICAKLSLREHAFGCVIAGDGTAEHFVSHLGARLDPIRFAGTTHKVGPLLEEHVDDVAPDACNLIPSGVTTILGPDADASTNIMEQALHLQHHRKRHLYFFRIVNLNPNRRKRIKIRGVGELSAEDVVVTMHRCVGQEMQADPAVKVKVQVSLMPCQVADEDGNFAGGLCTWRLPEEADINGFKKHLNTWQIGECVPFSAEGRDPALARVMSDLLAAGAFEGVDPGQVVQRSVVLNTDRRLSIHLASYIPTIVQQVLETP